MWRAFAVGLSALLLAGSVQAAASQTDPGWLARPILTIEANSAGLHNLGGFHPERNPTLRAAITTFGRPSARRARYGGENCEVFWRKIGLKMVFANYGGGSACHPPYGVAKAALIQGPRGRRWRTNRGLRLGDTREDVEQRHPSAIEWEGGYWLATGYSPIGEGSSYPVLAVRVRAGYVQNFEALMSPGYD